MKNFIKSLVSFFKKIKELFSGSKKEDQPVVEVRPVKQPKPVKDTPVAPVVQPADSDGDQIAVSDINAKVTTFLWKPVSDTNPMVTAITVSSDLARAEDVKIEILDKNGAPIKINSGYNVGGHKRGNLVPGHRFGRMVFKPGPTDKEFKKAAPLKVSFYLELNGKRTKMKVMGKDFVEVKDAMKRLDLK